MASPNPRNNNKSSASDKKSQNEDWWSQNVGIQATTINNTNVTYNNYIKQNNYRGNRGYFRGRGRSNDSFRGRGNDYNSKNVYPKVATTTTTTATNANNLFGNLDGTDENGNSKKELTLYEKVLLGSEPEELDEYFFDIDLNAKQGGLTLLHIACKAGNLACLNYLIDKGANINEKSDYNEALKNFEDTGLHLACRKGHINCVKALLNVDVDVKITNYYGNTALHVASMKGNFAIAKMLYEYGIDVNAPNLKYETAINYAVRNRHLKVVEYLLGVGADTTLANDQGKTPKQLIKDEILANGNSAILEKILRLLNDKMVPTVETDTLPKIKVEMENLKLEHEKVKEKQRIAEDSSMCIICCEKDRNAFILPCGHLATCIDCATELQSGTNKCPVCRTDITAVHKIFKA